MSLRPSVGDLWHQQWHLPVGGIAEPRNAYQLLPVTTKRGLQGASARASYHFTPPLPPPHLLPPRHAPYGPPSPAKSRGPRDLPICMPRSAPFRPLCGQKKVAHLSPVRDSADLFLPAGEINPFRRQKGEGARGGGRDGGEGVGEKRAGKRTPTGFRSE